MSGRIFSKKVLVSVKHFRSKLNEGSETFYKLGSKYISTQNTMPHIDLINIKENMNDNQYNNKGGINKSGETIKTNNVGDVLNNLNEYKLINENTEGSDGSSTNVSSNVRSENGDCDSKEEKCNIEKNANSNKINNIDTMKEKREEANENDSNEIIDEDGEVKKNISVELLKICNSLKNIGNKYFKEDNYIISLKYYTAAIDFIKSFYENNADESYLKLLNEMNLDTLPDYVQIDDEDIDLLKKYYNESTINKSSEYISMHETDLHIYYTNRSFCNMKLENYGLSIQDIDEAIKINPYYAKAYYRKGCSYLLLSDLKNASDCFQMVLKLTKDKNSELKLKQCKKLLFEQQFQKAIELEQKIPYYETIQLDNIKIENNNAPIYDRNNLNIDFLKKVVDYISVPNQKLNKKCVCSIILDVIKLLKESPTLVYLNLKEDETITICGDIHGQFYDLINIMNINGYPSTNYSYLFNGDFVDRGSFSVEVIIFLYLAKLTFPNNVYLTRGNHETDNMNKIYGFLGELLEKYDEKLHSLFSDSFKFLPLAYVLNNKVFICHGGIPSKTDVTLKDIEQIDRNTEPLDEGIMTDLLWSDPNEEKGFKPSKRGIGFSFGPDITENFLKNNNLSLIIRSHEVRDEGYSLEQNGQLYTVFSAPNYCDVMKNKGGFLKFKGNATTPECVKFTEVKHPNVPSLKYAHNLYQNI
ncbi:serine/threonine protein phosphatase 5, putative [Plasmodium vinckei]|uniref:Serine/threonine-protein phosphatase T n=1 Tax=Plasmodium vinckei TaxID=5860 RepID=A0A6V7T7Y8_PLAVN|nr:serine/threonine protein phosphatase 5, putative [Plasmodium vinckei]